MNRIKSIDIVRGLVMVIMALDHVRDLLNTTAQTLDPTNLSTTTASLFLTRWVTHFCAPTFVFLAGTSAYLSVQRGENRAFFIKRGLWLVLLEFTVITFGIWWDIHFNVFLFQVIAAIGLSFVVLGLLYRVPSKTLGIIGWSIVVLYGALSRLPISTPLVGFLYSVTALPLSATKTLVVGYPLLPWLGIMLIGYGTGPLFEYSSQERKTLFWKWGLVLLSLFVVIQLAHNSLFPNQLSAQKEALFKVLYFLNVSKYPPSLLYVLLTLGVMFLLLSLAERGENALSRFLITYGKVPMFYYLVHWYIIHSLMFVVLFAQGFGVKDFEFGFGFGRPKATNGLPLWGIYGVWIGVVLLLYPLCKWYGNYKKSHPEKAWLRYL
jgi:uncharacterized membrane protein